MISVKPIECAGCPMEKIGCGFVPDWTGPDLPESGPALGIMAEAPGQEEVWKEQPLVGATGKFLERTIFVPLGIKRRSIYLGNVLRCRPPENVFPANKQAVTHCRVHDSALKKLSPDLAVLTYHPAAALRNRSVFPLIRSAVKKALLLTFYGHRVLVAMGEHASSLVFPEIKRGGLRVWHNHILEINHEN